MPKIEAKVNVFNSYTPMSLLDVVSTRRERKSASADFTLVGRRSRELQTIQDRVELIAGELEHVHSPWISKKINALSDYFSRSSGNDLNTGFEDGSTSAGNFRTVIKDAFQDGLATTVTQEYRLSKNDISSNANFEDYDHIQDLITAYTFDFYRTLRVCERLNVAPGTALRLAKLAYRFNPNILIELTQKYPDMDAYIIKSAAVNYPSNPDAFLDGVGKAIDRLTQKYPDMDAYIITRAAVGYPSNPDAFLDGVPEGNREEILEKLSKVVNLTA